MSSPVSEIQAPRGTCWDGLAEEGPGRAVVLLEPWLPDAASPGELVGDKSHGLHSDLHDQDQLVLGKWSHHLGFRGMLGNSDACALEKEGSG